jgi:iron complex outermembrane receptor protein
MTTVTGKTRLLNFGSHLAIFAGISFSAAMPQLATAQAVTAGDGLATQDIVVTARRKEEKILETPIAISAFTSETLAQHDIKNLQDLGNFVPGLNIVGQASGGGRADRSYVAVVLRGMPPSSGAAQTTSTFIDGVPVSQATSIQVLTNPARVEVIKGPQSATFGRQTFAGAINVVTRDPSKELSGTASGMVATHGNYDGSIELSGPIFGDALGFRTTGRAIGKHGSYHNAADPGSTLGNQSSKAVTLELMSKPADNLTIKAFGLYSRLEDGPPANGVISAYSLTDPTGKLLRTDQSNCNVTGSSGVTTRFICGAAPALSSLSPSANTANTATVTNFLNNPSGRLLSRDLGPNGYGLKNTFYHVHLDVDYALGDSGISVKSLTGWNRELKSELADVDNFGSEAFKGTGSFFPEGYYNFTFLIEQVSRDFSQEVRFSFENGGPFHAVFGGSYLNAKQQGAYGSFNLSGSSRAGVTKNITLGGFTSLSYDFSRQISLSFDARYQVDKLYAYSGQGGVVSTGAIIPAGNYPEGSLLAHKAYKNFLPRVIAKYDFGSNMVYASFSKGVNPGVFNTLFINEIKPVVDEAARLGYKVEVAPEKITNYEIGTKGQLFGNRITYDGAAFLANWTDQIQQSQVQLNIDTNNDGILEPHQVSGNTNTGRVRIFGLEGNVSARLAKGLTLDLTGAYIDSTIRAASNAAVSALTGITNYAGKKSPFVSRWSGTAGLDYTQAIKHDLDGYGRVDFVYKSRSYADISNITWAPDMTQVNVRLGVRNKRISVEAFVTNLFNNKAYYSIETNSIISPTQSLAVPGLLVAQLRDLRTSGVRASISF